MILNGCWSSPWLQWYIILIMVYYHQVFDQDTRRLGFWPLANPNQVHWANQGIARTWGLWWLWGSSHDFIVHIEARVSPLSHFIRDLGLRLISALPNSSISWKSQLWSTVLDFMDLESVRWFERPHSCSYKSHLTYQRPRLKNWRSDKKFPKVAGDL